GIFERQDTIERLDDDDPGAERGVHIRELAPDRAGADDRERLRWRVRHHRIRRVPDAVVVDLQEGEITGARTGRDDDVLAGERLLLTPLGGDFNLPLPRDTPPTLD